MLISVFVLSSSATTEVITVCMKALRISRFIFMGISVAIQGILQSLGYALGPLIISLLRSVVFVFPLAYLFTKLKNVTSLVWWTFPITEILTAIISLFILKTHMIIECYVLKISTLFAMYFLFFQLLAVLINYSIIM